MSTGWDANRLDYKLDLVILDHDPHLTKARAGNLKQRRPKRRQLAGCQDG